MSIIVNAVVSDPRIDELKTLKTFLARKKFCDTNFKRLGAGSSRIAYDYSDDFVIKLAKNQKGLAQNNIETDGALRNYDIIPLLLDESDNGEWLIVQKAKKISEGDFESLAEVSFKNFCDYLRYQEARTRPGKLPEKTELLKSLDDNEVCQEIVDIMVNFDMPIGDLCRISSYGKTNQGQLKLIDPGLTKDVWNEYYAK